jgi:hypothetical protein
MTFTVETFPNEIDKERKIHNEVEKIEIVSMKLKEEYKDYQDLVDFIDYLRASEELFITSRIEQWTGEKLRTELIKNELRLASFNTGINEKVFSMLCEDFKTLAVSVSKLYDATDELLKKYADHPECKEFILYLRDISIVFVEVEKEGISFDEAKDRLFNIRMKVISVGGNPEMGILENIYREFKKTIRNA